MDAADILTPEALARASAPARRQAFIRFAVETGVIGFGDFTLKSGRQSPYFFNSGRFEDARALTLLGSFYAAAIVDSGIDFDVLFGPAYKGIPLAVAAGSALLRDHGKSPGIAYNRKEAKAHGEGGRIVGASLGGRVMLVDDVITAGTAIREVLPLIDDAGGKLCGVLTALDRQERGSGQLSAAAELAAELDVPVLSIATLADLENWLGAIDDAALLERVRNYRQRYGTDASPAEVTP